MWGKEEIITELSNLTLRDSFVNRTVTEIEYMYKVAIFWDIAPCSLCMNQCFVGAYHFHFQGNKSAEPETSMLAGG
jgi:hypothetical protein